MGHYKSNLRDLEFNLFEVFNLPKILESGNYGDLDSDTAKEILKEVRRLAEGPLAEAFASTDRNPPVFDPETHSVKLPEDFKKACRAFAEAGWQSIGISEELNGLNVPNVLKWSISEMLLGAQPAAFMYMAGPGFAQILHDNGNDLQKEWAKKIAHGSWGATMVLTEPDAGSDVGAGRTKAIKQEDGSWHIEGVKRFITSADSDDLFDNIFHLVLARPEGAGPGTKGLSLFFVPKYHYNFDTDELGERNGVFVTNVEHKMGLKASATCELTFGGHGVPAVGWMVGDELNNGIRQMFDVIEHARMMVGTKAISTLSTGYLNALEYAKERVQGPDLTKQLDKTSPRVTITHHPDIRRSLMTQKAYAEGLRAIYLFAAAHQNDDAAAIVSGADPEMAFRVNDFMLPIVKGVGSEQAYAKLTESLQTLGGSGFLQDYPLEQYIRDSKIDSLYEGTTAIQSMDFFFRKIVRDQMGAMNHVLGEVRKFLDSEAGNGRLKNERALLQTAVDDVVAMGSTLGGFAFASQEKPEEIYKVGQNSVRFLMATGDLLIGWLLLKQAEVALAALDNDPSASDVAFYKGKVEAASFFAKNVLPELSASRKIIENADNTLMEMDEASF